MTLPTIFLGIFVVTISSFAFAETLKESENIKIKNEWLEKKLKDVNKGCGAKMTAAVDWASFIPHFHDVVTDDNSAEAQRCSNPTPEQATTCAEGPCEQALDGIETVCRNSAEAKKAVAAKIQSVKCSWDASVPRNKIAFALKNGVLNVKYNYRGANADQLTSRFLEQNL